VNLVQFVTLASLILFVLVHVLGGRLDFLAATPRSVWLSAAGGVSVAYVFMHLLPELADHQETIRERAAESAGLLTSLESHAYMIALIGLGLFYAVERFARSAARQRGEAGGEQRPAAVFWTHLSAFAIYNVLIGYLLVHREETDLRGLIIYAVAMGLHFVVNDQGLRRQHGTTYHRYGRWLLAAAPVLGYLVGISTEVSPLLLASLFAFLAGGVILNVLKEELPEDRQSRFWAFAVGAALYSTLLMLTA
jgi:zinc transporter ZupT